MTEKRFRMVNHDEFDYELDYIMDNYKRMDISDVCDLLNSFNEENEQLKQYKQEVSDVLLSYSQKNLSAKQLGLLTAIMQELGVLE